MPVNKTAVSLEALKKITLMMSSGCHCTLYIKSEKLHGQVAADGAVHTECSVVFFLQSFFELNCEQAEERRRWMVSG